MIRFKKIAANLGLVSSLLMVLVAPAHAQQSLQTKSFFNFQQTFNLSSGLKNLWNIDTTKTSRAAITCYTMTAAADQSFLTKGKKMTETTTGIAANFYIYNTLPATSLVVQAGKKLTAAWLTQAQAYFGPYPCPQVNIFVPENFAGGSPGHLGIGGDGGFNYYWLLWHELTHSYFGTASAAAVWLREGASNVVPIFIGEDRSDLYAGKTQEQWNNEGFALYPPNAYGDMIQQFQDYGKLPEMKVYFQKNACNLQEPTNTNNTYAENSNWGRMFLLDLAARYGKEPVINALRAVYEKYRYTNLTKITDRDFYEAFMYYVSPGQIGDAKTFVGKKLCIGDYKPAVNPALGQSASNQFAPVNPLGSPITAGRSLQQLRYR